MKNLIQRCTITGLIVFSLLSGIITQCTDDCREGPLKNALIWRISGNDLPAPSYLFGTIHVVDSNDISVHSTIIEQLRRADALVFETNLKDPQYQQLALQHAMMEHDSLEGILPTDQFDVVKRFFLDEFDFPVEAVSKMKPFYIASLMGALDAKGKSKSHEEVLMEIAGKEAKMITGISTLEKESELIDKIDMKDQAAYMLTEIEAYRNGESELLKNEMMQAYEKADIEMIHVLISESLADFPVVFDQLFVSRNESWLPAMVALMHEQSCFFAVGVGHLPGESGLIRLLRKNGYKVSPVKMDFWFHDR